MNRSLKFYVSLFCLEILLFANVNSSIAAEIEVSKTEFGHPDFQGNWIHNKRVRLERPQELGLQRAFSAEEVERQVADLEARQKTRELPSDPNRPAPPVGELITNVADGNFIPQVITRFPLIDGEYRTSIIIDPADGRIARTDTNDIYQDWLSEGFGEFDGPEIRPANERCLNSPAQLPLIMQIGPEDSKTLQIVQTEDYVVLNAEYATSIRIIPLNIEDNPITWAQWRGVSVGRWDDNNLIVTTKLFRPEQSIFERTPSSADLEVIEVFSLTEQNELLYRFTFSDPIALAAPFTGELLLSKMEEGQFIYESACHEGNYALPGILAGARRQEMDKNQAQ